MLKNLYLVFVIASLFTTASANTAARPNIVFLVADDLGWADVSFHDGKIQTPQIDALARRGVRLEQFYAEPVCSPTRAAFLTGQYPRRFGITTPLSAVSRLGLPSATPTVASELRARGYTTAIVGKWHVGHATPAQFPLQHGFDRQYGMHFGEIDYYQHVIPKTKALDWFRNDEPLKEEGYSTHLITDESIRVIRAQPADKPLFLYVAYNAPHAPRQVPESYAVPYADMPTQRKLFSGQVAVLDEGIGKILVAIRERGWDENTLIVFFSDNGGPNPGRVADNGPLRGGKGAVFEGGVRVPCVAVWPKQLAEGVTWNGMMHVVDWMPTLLKVAGTPLSSSVGTDGLDVWSALKEQSGSPRHEILHTVGAASEALRVDDWKIVRNGGRRAADDDNATETKKGEKSGEGKDEWNLFNIAMDPAEKNDLAASEPAILIRLQQRLKAVTDRTESPLSEAKP